MYILVINIDTTGRVHLSPIPRGGEDDMDDLQRLKLSFINAKNNANAKKVYFQVFKSYRDF